MIGLFLFFCACFVYDCNWLGLNSPRFKSIGCCKELLQLDFVFEIPNGFFPGLVVVAGSRQTVALIRYFTVENKVYFEKQHVTSLWKNVFLL